MSAVSQKKKCLSKVKSLLSVLIIINFLSGINKKTLQGFAVSQEQSEGPMYTTSGISSSYKTNEVDGVSSDWTVSF